jgi:hypothetical protein
MGWSYHYLLIKVFYFKEKRKMQNTTLCFSFNSKHQLGVEPFERLPPMFCDAKKEIFDLDLKKFYFDLQ